MLSHTLPHLADLGGQFSEVNFYHSNKTQPFDLQSCYDLVVIERAELLFAALACPTKLTLVLKPDPRRTHLKIMDALINFPGLTTILFSGMAGREIYADR